MDWNQNFSKTMGAATALVRAGRLGDATQAIQQALAGVGAGAGGAPRPAPVQPARPALPTTSTPRWAQPLGAAQDLVQDAVVIDRSSTAPPSNPRSSSAAVSAPASARSKSEAPGSFERVAFSYAGAQHHYRLYVPPGAVANQPMPLVLMLHGCTQSPDDFATGTGMNPAAAQANALVLYPAQPRSANANACWNWFDPSHQHRGTGEPALLVAMVRDVEARHHVDAQRVYVAGLSAGGAMAAVLAREYPDVFAAVGVHSGLQAGAAHNLMAALSAMSTGTRPTVVPAQAPPQGVLASLAPLIVFHGDADTTVHAKNGEQLVDAALLALAGTGASVQRESIPGQSAAGQRYTRTVYRQHTGASATANADTDVVAEHWALHGAGHAWSGGHAPGSHTDPRGISATQEMLRFFLAHPQKAQH